MSAVLRGRRSRHAPSASSGSNMAQPETVPKEKACMLCHQTQADTDICGDKRVKFKLCVHTYCQILASGLYPREDTGNFLVADTRRIIGEAAKKSCFVCSNMGATITCCETGCDRTFHLPCAPDGQCVTQYFGAYRSFCWEHRPQQALQPRPSQDTTCSICLDPVEDKISYKTMGCPACQDARFHRHCIRRLALHAGTGFRCPCCLKQEPFLTEMLIMGIRLSKRPPSWQSDQEVGPSSDQRHGRCDASRCLCLRGREHVEANGPWQLWLCSSCAAEGTHQLCSSLESTTCSWECSTCAAAGTASSGKSELVSPKTSSQELAALSQSTVLLKSSSSISPRQALKWHYAEEETPSWTMYSSPAKRRSVEDGPAHSADTCEPSTSSQAAAQLSQGEFPVKTSSSSSCPRQAFKRAYPEEDNDSGISHGPPAKRRRIDNGLAQSAHESGPSTSRQAVSGLSQGTLAANSQAARPRCPYRPPWIIHTSTMDNRSQPGPVRMRHVWRQQRRAKKPYSRPQ
ncbi:PHD finger protein 7-like isoform X1 [Vidua chalybeata]|uniref:PHD finger protein 7-like isoform X1 n=1 Tax=Vidua chalybeata TaxID=81927 RepID=UPI0023A84767|nr:PHD finger protein 7-like isoform X1 [Vidua chalybeata]